jgi:hypothetical protein
MFKSCGKRCQLSKAVLETLQSHVENHVVQHFDVSSPKIQAQLTISGLSALFIPLWGLEILILRATLADMYPIFG